MKVADWLPDTKNMEALQGVEKALRVRRRRGTQQSVILLVVGAVLQVLPLLAGKDLSMVGNGLVGLLSRDPKALGDAGTQLIGLGLVLVGAVVYVLARHSSLLLSQSREPFRYSFSVARFTQVEGTPGDRQLLEAADRLNLLHLDLTERIAGRIKRLSLLQPAAGAPASATPSHIAIEGDIALREDPDNGWELYALPRVRIGSADAPQVLAFAVKFRLGPATKGQPLPFGPDQYLQFCERVYASVAFTVYGQIDSDLDEKLRLFPTTYRRAVARLNEADDLAQSNTIEATERAAHLYRQALADFNRSWTRLWARTAFIAWLPLALYYRVYCARSAILSGLARCTVAHAQMAILVGRRPQATHALRQPLVALVDDLQALDQRAEEGLEGPARPLQPARAWPGSERRRQARQLRRREVKGALLDARVALALAHDHVGEVARAGWQVRQAATEAPDLVSTHRDHLWLVARGESVIDARIDRLRSLMELHPDFQLGQWELAYFLEMQMRARGALRLERFSAVLREYRRVLEINPGNVAALVALGYIHWLLDDTAQAQARFLEGIDLKEVVRETFVGELSQGLARVRAEQALAAGDTRNATRLLMESLELYELAVATDPTLAISSASTERQSSSGPFEAMVPAMLDRYLLYRRRVQQAARRLCDAVDTASRTPSLTDRLRGHVANDVGNAALEAHVRLRNPRHLRWSLRCYGVAARLAPDLAPAWLNLHIGASWQGGADATALDKAIALQPAWLAARSYRIERLRIECKEARERLNNERAEQDRRFETATEELRAQLRERYGARQLRTEAHDPPTRPRHASRQLMKETARVRRDARRAIQNMDGAEQEFRDRWTTRVRDEIAAQLERVPVGRQILAAGGVPSKDRPHPFSSVLRDEATNLSDLMPAHIDMLRQCAQVLLVLKDTNALVLREVLELAQALRDRLSNEDFALALLHKEVLDEWLATVSTASQDVLDLRSHQRAQAHEAQRSMLRLWARRDPVNSNTLEWLHVEDPAFFESEAWDRAVTHPHADEAALEGMAWLRLQWAGESTAQLGLNGLGESTDKDSPRRSAGRHARIAQGLARRLRAGRARSVLVSRYRAHMTDLRQSIALWDLASHRGRVCWLAAVAMRVQGEEAWPAWMRVVDAAADWLQDAPLDETARQRFEQAAGRADRFADSEDQRHQLRMRVERARTNRLGAHAPGDRWWQATPIMLEMAGDLVDLVAREDNSLTKEVEVEVTRMKDAVRDRYGVRLPGVQFTGNLRAVANGSFVVSVQDVPVESARIDKFTRYWPVPVGEEAAARAQWPGAAWHDDPLHQTRFVKLAEDVPNVSAVLSGAPLSPLAMMMRHLRGALDKRLESFVGEQEIDLLLDDAGVSIGHPARTHPHLTTRLSSLARSLLVLGLPLAPPGLADLVAQEDASDAPPDFDRLLMRSRKLPAIKERLMERLRGCQRWGLEPELLAVLTSALHGEGDARCLVLTSSIRSRLLKAVREAVGTQADFGVVVDAPMLVPGLWAVLRGQWPGVLVVAADELPTALWFDLQGALRLG